MKAHSPIKVIQIKGSNGSGKTTIVKQLMQLSREVYHVIGANDAIYATVLADMGYVLIGPYYYDRAVCGIDCMKSTSLVGKACTMDDIKQAILDVRDDYPGFWIIFEGMLISTIKSTMYDFLLELEQSDGIVPRFVILKTDLEHCLKRLSERGTMRDKLQHWRIEDKCKRVIRNAQEYDQRYVAWMNVDDIKLDNMLMQFLWLIEDWDLLDMMADMPEELWRLDRSKSPAYNAKEA